MHGHAFKLQRDGARCLNHDGSGAQCQLLQRAKIGTGIGDDRVAYQRLTRGALHMRWAKQQQGIQSHGAGSRVEFR